MLMRAELQLKRAHGTPGFSLALQPHMGRHTGAWSGCHRAQPTGPGTRTMIFSHVRLTPGCGKDTTSSERALTQDFLLHSKDTY